MGGSGGLLAAVFAVILTLLPLKTMAQSPRMTIDMKDVAMSKVISAIEEQTKYLFLNRDVDVSQKTSVSGKDIALEEVLRQMVSGTDAKWAFGDGKSIILSKKAVSAQTDMVTGVVLDQAGQPVTGAAVALEGTMTGATADIDGKFSFKLPKGTESGTLNVTFLGYKSAIVNFTDKRNFTVVLQEESTALEGTVVTALGIKRSEKALNYNVQTVKGDDVVAVKDANFINSLSGKVAGLNINAGSSGIGGASKVVMRGSKGIEQSSNALYVVDGVPMYSLMSGDGGETGYSTRGRTDVIADINPEDIESISVLTGAAAAALYGSYASNGAVVITTKKGQAGKLEVTASSNTEVMRATMLPKFQNTYGNKAGVATSWGDKLNEYNRWNGGYSPSSDFFQTGVTSTETVTMSFGNERNQTYASANVVNAKGVVPNNGYDRYGFTMRNTTNLLNDKLVFDVGASYVIQKDVNMINQGIYGNPLVSAYLYPRGEDWEYAKIYEQYDASRKIMAQNWEWMSKGGIEWDNPYWTAYRNVRKNSRKRYMLNAGLTYNILDWMKLSGRVKVDNTTGEYTDRKYAGTNTTITEGSSNGYYGVEENRENQIYADVLLSMNKDFNDLWSINANVGASISDLSQNTFMNRGGIRSDGLPNVFNVMQLDPSAHYRQQSGWREQTQSVYASAEIGFHRAVYLTLTGRNDWPSQLAGAHSSQHSFFYPSAGLSVVLSELVKMPEMLEYVKFRGSWASVGMPFSRYIANPTYEWNASSATWETSKNYPIYDLKPERTDSKEVGITLRFLKYFNLDASYYDARTYNQTFNSQLSVSSGYTNLYVQTGSVRNRGVELLLGFDKTWGKFNWHSSYTFSHNKNKIIKLMENYRHPETGEVISLDHLDMGGLNNFKFVLKPGGTLGDAYSTIDLVRDDIGKVYIDEEGKISTTTNVGYLKLGSVLPKANMAWSNDFTLCGVNFGFQLSARLGGICYSATQARLDSFGVSEVTEAARDAGGIVVDDCLMSAENWYTTIGANNGIPQYYTYSATNFRLSEAHIGYTIPRKKLGNVCDLTLSIVGRNLWMIYCKAPFDPESVATTGNYYQGIDYFMMPTTRNVGFNVRIKF